MNYHRIYHDNMLNGEGLRVVLFVSGCSHHCKNCHNPETWDEHSGKYFDKAALDEIEYYLKQDYTDGITFTGGDPLYINNLERILQLCIYFKYNYPSKTIWIYSGYKFEDIINGSSTLRHEILNWIDVLVDGQFVEDLKDRAYPYAGSTNQRIIDVHKSLKENKVILYNIK